jgi:starch synthase
MARLLFVASEAYPLIKTGGLADVAGSLPSVLHQSGMDVRLLLPAYQDVLERVEGTPSRVATIALSGTPVDVLETRLPGTELPTWLLHHPIFSERPGNPYHDASGQPWPDNAQRFMLLSRLAATISTSDTPLEWRPDVLHCNDWHTGPAVALTHLSAVRPTTVFTIHNLAHMGLFDHATFNQLQLPPHFWGDDALGFYNNVCFIKGGLVYADWITTVSPTYAGEICVAPAGAGLEGLLSHRRDRLVGILNGIDDTVWNPASDPYLAQPYDADTLELKVKNKTALQQELGLQVRNDCPLIGFIGRLVEQKGVEFILALLDGMYRQPAQIAILGTGDPAYQERLSALADRQPGALAVMLDYNEGLAHRIEAGADMFLMPSLFEPCGLNQLYSLRYGTLPIVRAVGGLVDTVVDARADNIEAGTANGFVFSKPEPGDLFATLWRAIGLWQDTASWRQMQLTAMAQDFSWQRSADQYLELYRSGPQF